MRRSCIHHGSWLSVLVVACAGTAGCETSGSRRNLGEHRESRPEDADHVQRGRSMLESGE